MKTLVLGLMISALSSPAMTATLQVTISDIRSDKGDILVAVCPKQDFLRPQCAYHDQTAAKPGSVTVTIPDIPPGLWAVQAFQDENGNGTIDRTFLGMPKEGMGFSRDAPMRFGPPAWNDADFTLGPDGGAVTFKQRYYD